MTVLIILPSCKEVETRADNLYADSYINYATEVFLNPENPDFDEMGLFWTYWDEETGSVVEVPADSEEGAALIDPDKPTIINVHGMLADGYYSKESYNINHRIVNPADFGLDTDRVNACYLWLNEGYNVGNFHYNKFATEVPTMIEAKIWAIDGKEGDTPVGVRYKKTDGKFSAPDVTAYSLAEHFAAEYIRAMNLLPDEMGNKEIRIAAHSMGGMLSGPALFLLTELSKAGQIAKSKLPVRYAMMDAYFSTYNENVYWGPSDITIRWSGKPLIDNNTAFTLLECLKALDKEGIALEYYTYDSSTLYQAMKHMENEISEITAFAIINPRLNYKGYNMLSQGHNAVREWYLCSILSEPVINTSEPDAFAPSAALPTAYLKTLIGKKFKLTDGYETLTADDDKMIFLS
ncbi:MAG: hypothetical protein ACOX3U_06915 [Christensenellales bacterium]